MGGQYRASRAVSDRARAIHATLRRDMLPPASLPFAESIERVGCAPPRPTRLKP